MAFPLDVYPIMSEITELREKSEGAATAGRSTTTTSPTVRRPAVESSTSPSPKRKRGRTWERVKRGLRSGGQYRDRGGQPPNLPGGAAKGRDADDGDVEFEDDSMSPTFTPFPHSTRFVPNPDIPVDTTEETSNPDDEQNSGTAKNDGTPRDSDEHVLQKSSLALPTGLEADEIEILLQWGGLEDDIMTLLAPIVFQRNEGANPRVEVSTRRADEEEQ